MVARTLIGRVAVPLEDPFRDDVDHELRGVRTRRLTAERSSYGTPLRETRCAWIGTSGADRRDPIQVAEAQPQRGRQPWSTDHGHAGDTGSRHSRPAPPAVRRGGKMVTCLAKVQS